MNIRKYEQQDYELLCSWYKDWTLPITPRSWLSTTGIVIENEGPVCMGFLFQLGDSKMFWIEGVISNKNKPSDIRKAGLKALINELSYKAKERGAEIVMTSTPRNSLKQLFIEQGFNCAQEKYEHIGRLI